MYSVDIFGHCSAVQCSAVQLCAVQCWEVQCSFMQCSVVQCSAVECSVTDPVMRSLAIQSVTNPWEHFIPGPV